MKKILTLLLSLTLLFLYGCSARENARFIFQRDVDGSFLDGGKSDSYNFFIYGGGGFQPVAYLALDKSYTLQTQFWDPTAMNAETWNKIYRSPPYMEEDRYQGRAIVLQDGSTIGYILTRHYQVFAWRVEPGSNTILVPPPSLQPGQPEYRRWRIDDR